jgi:hypothetical protein
MAVPEYPKARRLGFLALRGAHGDAFVLVLRVGVQQVTRLRLKSDRLLLFDLEGSFKAQVDFVHRRAGERVETRVRDQQLSKPAGMLLRLSRGRWQLIL